MAKGKPEEQEEQEVNYEDKTFICIKKCYFDSNLYDPEDETGYIPGIENSPYFEMAKE